MAAMKDRPEREDHVRQRIERGRFDARVPSRRERAMDVANRKACRVHEGLGVEGLREAPADKVLHAMRNIAMMLLRIADRLTDAVIARAPFVGLRIQSTMAFLKLQCAKIRTNFCAKFTEAAV